MGLPHLDPPDLPGHLGKLLNQRMSAAQFWRWFVDALPRIDEVAPDNEAALAWRVEHRFAEWTGGHIDEDALRAVLARDVAEFGVDVPVGVG